jgi:hypothetical protein
MAIAAYRYNRQKGALKYFSLLIFFSAFFEIFSVVSSRYSMNNLPYLYLYITIEFGLCLLFYRYLFDRPALKSWLGVMAAIFLTTVVLEIWFEGLNSFSTFARTAEALGLTCLSLYYFYTLMKSDHFIQLEKSPYFWINTGVLLYFMGNFFMFLSYKFIMEHDLASHGYWTVHSMLNIIANLLFAIGLLCKTPEWK